MCFYLSYQKFAQPRYISCEIHHLLAETFTCIFSLELWQWSTLNSHGKNVLLYSRCAESTTYQQEGFFQNRHKQFLSSCKEARDFWIMGNCLSLFEFFKAFAISTFHAIAKKERAIHILLVILNSLSLVSFTFVAHSLYLHALQFLQLISHNFLISLTWQCTPNTLLMDFPNFKLLQQMCFELPIICLKIHSSETPE